MKIYIASSWKNLHAVRLLTKVLKDHGYAVSSCIQHMLDKAEEINKPLNIDKWNSIEINTLFQTTIKSAMRCDVLIYVSPSGTDAWAAVGAAYGKGKIIMGLDSKGEQAGLMREMVTWYDDYEGLLEALELWGG